jgi:Zn-dependent peptidase ImmA (M78 family)/transcriptional regulator with XRE-family HTH domain
MKREPMGESLRRARQSLRLSQTTVATYLGLSRQAVSASESGKRAITVAELLKLSDLYRLPPEAFLRPRPIPSQEDFDRVQRRANAVGEKPLDDHDVYEIAAFMDALQVDAGRRSASIRPIRNLPASASPFRQLSKIADHVRSQSDLNKPPINVYKALSDFEIRVRMTSLNTISGAFIPAAANHGAGVLINSSQPPDRQRYSAAHELGHCVLGHAGPGTEEIVSPLGRRFGAREVEADSFASELLMPVNLLIDEINRLSKSDAINKLVYSLADRFLVSYQAMTYRLANINAITPTQKEELLKTRPTEIEARLKLKQRPKKVFESRLLREMCGKVFPLELLREPDGVRQLQELAFEEYARGVTEVERADSAGHVYEKVALWVAKTHPLAA